MEQYECHTPNDKKNGNNEYNLSLRLANLFTKYDFERIRQSCQQKLQNTFDEIQSLLFVVLSPFICTRKLLVQLNVCSYVIYIYFTYFYNKHQSMLIHLPWPLVQSLGQH